MKFLIFCLFLVAIEAEDLNKEIPKYEELRFKHGNHTINRPNFHFTPKYGWMNDPNGCWYDKENNVYHLYFQYNPANTIWEMPLYWGHAISSNLNEWEEQNIAIKPADKLSGAYSGSVFIDANKLFPFFSESEPKYKNNVIAAWTFTDSEWLEFQYLSYSHDDGNTFSTPDTEEGEGGFKNPAVEGKDSAEFRDPQVIRVAYNVYIMSVARSHEYQIEFYKADSESQKKFKMLGKFGLIGYLGYQYECPNLAHLSITEGSSDIYPKPDYWVLFISINPGSIQGGSSTQYFIGEFNYNRTDTPFVVFNQHTTVIDYGKDFYAMQLFFEPQEIGENQDAPAFNIITGIGWASNWQYTALVPTDPWRSSMSIPRELKLGVYQPAPSGTDPSPKLLYVLQKPIIKYELFDTDTDKPVTSFTYIDSEGKEQPQTTPFIPGNYRYHADLTAGAGGSLEFTLEFEFFDVYTNDKPGVINIYLIGGSIPSEYLKIGYNNKADAFFIDRGHTNVQWCKDNPFFTDKVNVNLYKKEVGTSEISYQKEKCTAISDKGVKTCSFEEKKDKRNLFKVYGLIDMNIMELFFNQDNSGFSVITSTNTFFFTGGNFISSIDIIIDDNTKEGFYIKSFQARQLNLKSKNK